MRKRVLNGFGTMTSKQFKKRKKLEDIKKQSRKKNRVK